ncbi:MAG TPA: hypothetical protein VFK50_01710 [Sphingomicrobium sp.]|nr:hypothetical protein [Sphingomicrobium sp.]
MAWKFRSLGLAATIVGAALLGAGATARAADEDHRHDADIGTLSFETSCNPAAEALIREGAAWLHSFGYPDAETSFRAAAAADADCAIAQWGIAMSQFHPLWEPPTAAELAKGRAAMSEAATRPGKANAIERGLVSAIATFFDPARTTHAERVTAYSQAMRDLLARFSSVHEVRAFTALSLLAVGLLDKDPGYAREKEAAILLDEVFAVNPDHPGVTHYLIHGFDSPSLAPLALAAAKRYAKIAPDSAHAHHMPSHIFVRLGMWEDAISSNINSEASAMRIARRQGLADSSSERLHAMDYLAYGYLQLGRDRDAARVLANLGAIRQADPPVFSVAYAATAIPARYALERRQWQDAASLKLPGKAETLASLDQYPWGRAHIYFAQAVGAARSGQVERARTALDRLVAIRSAITVPAGTYDWANQVEIQRRVAAAWVAQAEGRKADALATMREAADLDDRSEKHPVTPGQILPAREQLGELLLDQGNAPGALAEFRAALERAPNRFGSIYGAARAARALRDRKAAEAYYRQLAALPADPDRAGIAEARAFLGGQRLAAQR